MPSSLTRAPEPSASATGRGIFQGGPPAQSTCTCFTVERVVPLSQPEQGQNAFEARGRLTESPAWLRPGMEGVVRLKTEPHSLLWIGTRRIVDQLRLWLWW